MPERPVLRQPQDTRLTSANLLEAAGSGDFVKFDRIKGEALRIDKFNLDAECERFPDSFYNVADALTMQMSQRDAVSQELKDVEAECFAELKNVIVPEGKKKMTEKEIAAEVRLSPDVQKLRTRLSQMTRATGKLGALKEAYQERSAMLKNLVTLAVANYYSMSVGMPRDAPGRERLNQERTQRLETARTNVRQARREQQPVSRTEPRRG